MEIYVGNLSGEVTEADLEQAFTAFGKVESAKIITDRFSGQPRGFGFVSMASSAEANTAIAALNGKELKGRVLTVNQARGRSDRPGGGSGGGGGRGGFGGGGGGGGGRRY